MNNTTHIIEQITWVTPFGVRFWDEISGSVISEGLSVTAYRAIAPNNRIAAFPNHSGVYVLLNAPGPRTIRQREEGATLPYERPFLVEVIDSYRRFQPFLFTAMLPTRGLFMLDCGLTSPLASSPLSSPLESPTAMLPLYSSPTRTMAESMAVVRAQLWDDQQNTAAAWAMLEVYVAGQLAGRSYADNKGRVAVFFPYPAPENLSDADDTSGSFAGDSTALARQQWDISITVAYSPQPSVPVIPDLCIVQNQSLAYVWNDSAHTQPFPGGTLTFGQELTLRSDHVKPQTQPSVLLVTPAV